MSWSISSAAWPVTFSRASKMLTRVACWAAVKGYAIGGIVHVITNDLIGFTAGPRELHTSRFTSDIAKRLSIPIFHVNAEDPDAAVRIARLATEYRHMFKSDVVIDLIGFRR